MLAAASLLGLLPLCLALGVGSSLIVWMRIAERRRQGLPILDQASTSAAQPSVWALLAATGWVLLSLADRLTIDLAGPPTEPKPEIVWGALSLSLTVFAVILSLLLIDRHYTWRDIGIDWSRTRQSAGLGVATCCAAILPTAFMLLVTFPLRSRETQHTLLRLLADSPDPLIIAGLGVTAVIVAPLSEELLFRVTLQGWWQRRIGSSWSVSLVAVVFAMVHGYRDGLALIPLALMLGYVYDRQRDYLAVVIAHGLFNTGNLVLALLAMQAQAPVP